MVNCSCQKISMKKIIFVFVLSFFFLNLRIVAAESNSVATKSNSVATKSDLVATQEIVPTPPVDYALPYSGLLPDNPLYFLKVTRDKIVNLLISDSLKKADFDLLQADKRIGAALSLFNSSKKNSKKAELIGSTASKAEDYFEKAIQKVKEAKKEGKETKDLAGRLNDSVRKHQELLKMMNLTSLLGRAKVFQQEAEALSPR